jgi:thiopeptide-type bacteriocin biosynthesis protein
VHFLPRVLVRAPLLPLAFRGRLEDAPLGAEALRLASPDLAAGLARGDPGAAAAAERYGARARFRPTPHGLLAGVGLGRLDATTRIDTGAPAAHATPSYARLARLARAVLDDPAARRAVRLRAAPSLLRHGDHAMWLGRDGEAFEAEVDDVVGAALRTARGWTPWARVARAVGDEDVVLALVDDGLLVSELTPPLVGPPPADWLRARLPAAPLDAPGEVHATLLFPDADVAIAVDVVERAARLAPLLVRLAAALMPPTAERDLDPAIAEAARVAAETFGPGALDLGTFALGGYGARPDEGLAAERPAPPAALLTLLYERFADPVARFSAAELDAVLPDAPLPATFELLLTPRRAADGWLLGWHAPAGATWGRFAHAYPPVADALAELARLEPPGRLDVAFAPDPGLGDLAAHPPIRAATLALSTWPDAPSRTPAELALVAPPPLALDGGTPAPLHRLRSTTAPPGVYQLLAGWSLHRQHAPWALALPAALAELAHTPRVEIEGFVVAPASWRLPHPGAPAMVQVGHEDELLPVAAAEARGRAWEIWPPLDEATADAAGRRVEIVALVVAGAEPTPRRRPRIDAAPDPRWRSFVLYGPRDRQDRLLVEAIAPAIAAARDRGEIDGWFFLRYKEGARHQLRVRVRGDGVRFARRLDRALAPALTAGDLVTRAEGPYHPERARYGAALAAALAIFEDDSDAAIALLAEDGGDVELVRDLDGLAARLGLGAEERHALATALRGAHDPHPDADARFRAHARALAAALAATPRPRKSRARPAAADLIHLAVNRRAGVDPAREALAATLWQRALEGLTYRRASRRSRRRPPRT